MQTITVSLCKNNIIAENNNIHIKNKWRFGAMIEWRQGAKIL